MRGVLSGEIANQITERGSTISVAKNVRLATVICLLLLDTNEAFGINPLASSEGDGPGKRTNRVTGEVKYYPELFRFRDFPGLKHPSSGALFIKRVIGVAGNTVGPGPGIFVNGQQFRAPVPCGAATPQTKYDPADYSAFQTTTVPEGTFFVVGDNLGNSFDSRIPEFGRVTSEMVRGKPLYLYWSSDKSRIGCKVH